MSDPRKTAEAVLEIPSEEFGEIFFVWCKVAPELHYTDELTSADLKELARDYLEKVEEMEGIQ